MDNINTLIWMWKVAKEQEKEFNAIRVEVEQKLIKALNVDKNSEGTSCFDTDYNTVKITKRINTKINTDLLSEIAYENEMNDALSDLFRWKPEIKSKEWKDCSEEIKKVFYPAITQTPGKPSFSITEKEKI